MKPLLNIRTVPIELEFKTTRAALRPNELPQPRADVTRSQGKRDIRQTPGRLNIDSTDAKASIGIKPTQRSVSEFAENSRAEARNATRETAEGGSNFLDRLASANGNPIIDVALSKLQLNRTREFVLDFIPSVAPQIEYTPGNVSFDFTMDRLEYNWNVNSRPQFDFVPGGVEFTVVQHPQVIIEYMGGPIYVPRSADPNYQPPPGMNNYA
jgi:hypothetical protein